MFNRKGCIRLCLFVFGNMFVFVDEFMAFHGTDAIEEMLE